MSTKSPICTAHLFDENSCGQRVLRLLRCRAVYAELGPEYTMHQAHFPSHFLSHFCPSHFPSDFFRAFVDRIFHRIFIACFSYRIFHRIFHRMFFACFSHLWIVKCKKMQILKFNFEHKEKMQKKIHRIFLHFPSQHCKNRIFNRIFFTFFSHFLIILKSPPVANLHFSNLYIPKTTRFWRRFRLRVLPSKK